MYQRVVLFLLVKGTRSEFQGELDGSIVLRLRQALSCLLRDAPSTGLTVLCFVLTGRLSPVSIWCCTRPVITKPLSRAKTSWNSVTKSTAFCIRRGLSRNTLSLSLSFLTSRSSSCCCVMLTFILDKQTRPGLGSSKSFSVPDPRCRHGLPNSSSAAGNVCLPGSRGSHAHYLHFGTGALGRCRCQDFSRVLRVALLALTSRGRCTSSSCPGSNSQVVGSEGGKGRIPWEGRPWIQFRLLLWRPHFGLGVP